MRFSDGEDYAGTVGDALDETSATVQFDDGTSDVIRFPDPDVRVLPAAPPAPRPYNTRGPARRASTADDSDEWEREPPSRPPPKKRRRVRSDAGSRRELPRTAASRRRAQATAAVQAPPRRQPPPPRRAQATAVQAPPPRRLPPARRRPRPPARLSPSARAAGLAPLPPTRRRQPARHAPKRRFEDLVDTGKRYGEEAPSAGAPPRSWPRPRQGQMLPPPPPPPPRPRGPPPTPQLIAGLQKTLSCPLCHELFDDACTLPCGHTFCHGCVHGHFDTVGHACPRCKVPWRRQDITPAATTRGLVRIFARRDEYPS